MGAICRYPLPTARFSRNGDRRDNDNNRTRFGIAAAFGVVDFTKNEFKISLRSLSSVPYEMESQEIRLS